MNNYNEQEIALVGMKIDNDGNYLAPKDIPELLRLGRARLITDQ